MPNGEALSTPIQLSAEESTAPPAVAEATEPSLLRRTINFYCDLGKIMLSGNGGEAVREAANHL